MRTKNLLFVPVLCASLLTAACGLPPEGETNDTFTTVKQQTTAKDEPVKKDANGVIVEGHFDRDDLKDELLTFKLDAKKPSLSIISIKSLGCYGYVVEVKRKEDNQEKKCENGGSKP